MGITFDGYDKYAPDDCILKDIKFIDDADEIKKFYFRGNGK